MIVSYEIEVRPEYSEETVVISVKKDYDNTGLDYWYLYQNTIGMDGIDIYSY
jgi:hypothetical protein